MTFSPSPRALLAFELGLAAHAKHDFATALARFEEAVDAAPEWHEARFALAHTLERLERSDEALAEVLASFDPGPPSAAAIKFLCDLIEKRPHHLPFID